MPIDPETTSAPTPQRRRQSETLPPHIDPSTSRHAWLVLDVLTRYASKISPAALAALRSYVEACARVETASLALGRYDVPIDGWRTEVESDTGASAVEKDAREIAWLHRQLGRQLRPLADALVLAVINPQIPCPFETLVGKDAVIPALNSIAEHLLQTNNNDG